jgi:hypothetical protein
MVNLCLNSGLTIVIILYTPIRSSGVGSRVRPKAKPGGFQLQLTQTANKDEHENYFLIDAFSAPQAEPLTKS